MVFSAPIFLFLFLPLAILGVLLTPRAARNWFLLLVSVIFYAWGGAVYVPLLLALVALNWVSGLLIGGLPSPLARQRVLQGTILLDVAILVYYKYTGFILGNLTSLGLAGPLHHAILLPLGISFFTFHLISYVVDIHRGTAAPQRNPINFALYICFFPQLIAGPIIRYHDVDWQLTGRQVSLDKFASGVERFVVGLAKKLLLANSFAVPADAIFGLQAEQLSPGVAWLGLIFYALQLYFDFSGYSDMAIGLGRMFGFEYLENFNYPFISRSLSEFWRRWHISLSNWFRDYMYTPLAMHAARRLVGRRGPDGRRIRFDDRPQLALVFLVCGIWHGANWTFVIWGAIHGIFLALERGGFGRAMQRLPRACGHMYVLAVILLAWVFFRAPTVGAAADFLYAMAGHRGAAAARSPAEMLVGRQALLLLPAGLLGLTPAFSWLTRDWRARARQIFGQLETVQAGAGRQGALDWVMLAVRPPVLLTLMLLCATYVAGQTYNPFIYFRF